MRTHPITIDIISDIVCPWCWLGKQYVEAAIKQFPDMEVQINWRPFMLDADIPDEGLPYQYYMKKKFSGDRVEQFQAMREKLIEAAGPAGIEFNFDDIPVRPNTLKAHCLLKWAAKEGKSTQASEALFKAFFQEGLDVGNNEVLIKIARKLGMNEAMVQEMLKSVHNKQAIKSELAYFQELGVSSVPTFIYNGTFAVAGGQPTDAHMRALEKASTTPPKDIMTVLHA